MHSSANSPNSQDAVLKSDLGGRSVTAHKNVMETHNYFTARLLHSVSVAAGLHLPNRSRTAKDNSVVRVCVRACVQGAACALLSI